VPADLLPVRPHLVDGEALHSYATRLAHANGLALTELLARPLNVGLTAARARILSAASGLPVEQLLEATLDRYPPAIRGTAGTHRGGWRLHGAKWYCPRCTPLTGIIRRDWALALHPICRGCGIFLTPATASAPTPETAPAPQVADRELLDVVDALLVLTEDTRTNRQARATIRRLSRLCVLIAQTIDDQWPHRPATAPLVDVSAARGWGCYPAEDPATVAAVLLATAPALTSPAAERELIRDGYTRLRHATSAIPRPAPRYRPKRPTPARTRAILPGLTTADRERLDWLSAQLGRLVTVPGLRPRHIPALACLPGEEPLPDSGVWSARANAAIALYMLVSGLTGGFVAASTACHAFGTAHTETSRLVSGIALGRGISAAHAQVLLGTAEGLVDDGLIDYLRRRDILRDIRTLTWRPHRRLDLPAVDGTPGAVLALGWMWMMLTRGPLYTSNTPTLPAGRVLRFGARIDLETQLVLYEHGMRLLTDPDSDADTELTVVPTPAVSRPAVLRRLG